MSFPRHLFAQDRSRPHYSGPFYLWHSTDLPLPSSYFTQTSYLYITSSPRPYPRHTVTWPSIMPHMRGQVLTKRVLRGGRWQTRSTSISVPFESDSRTRDINSVHISIQHNDTAEGPVTVQVPYDEAYIQGSKSNYLVHCKTGGDNSNDITPLYKGCFLYQIQFKTSIDQSTIGKCSQLKQKKSKRCHFFKFIWYTKHVIMH